MTKKTATVTAILATIGLTAVALPATAQEPASEAPPPAVCVENDETSMRHDAMEGWIGEMGGEVTAACHHQTHDDMHNMMAMMQGSGVADQMGEGSIPGPRSMMGADHMGARSMMGSPAMNPGSTMSGGS